MRLRNVHKCVHGQLPHNEREAPTHYYINELAGRRGIRGAETMNQIYWVIVGRVDQRLKYREMTRVY